MAAVYLDSSALVKLAVREAESDALRRHLRRRRPWVSSALARIEVLRSLLPGGEQAVQAGGRVLARCELIRINESVLHAAATMPHPQLRSLDAIHLATADQVRNELGGLITYDERMAAAARELGYRVSAPS
jgi:predicted nucleic acid-binding protein